MKLGIAGAGGIVKDFLQCASQCNLQLTAICATKRNEDNLRNICETYGFKRYYTDYDEMLNDQEIDTVYIALPNNLHYRFGLKALQAGKNVIMEKPFTSNRKQAEKLIEEAGKRDLIIIEAITTLYLPTYSKLQESLNEIGDLRIVTLNFTQYSSKYDQFKQGIIKPAFDVKQSGGALMDLNVYNIHLIVSLFGVPEKVSYLGNMNRDVDTSGIVTLDYPGFKAVSIAAKDCASPYISAFQGDGGNIVVNGPTNFLQSFTVTKNNGDKYEIGRDETHRMQYEFNCFADIIDNKRKDVAEKMNQETLSVMQVLDEARSSSNIVFEDDSNL